MKLIKALFQWLFARGYIIGYKQFNSISNNMPIGRGAYGIAYHKVMKQTCKVCKGEFYAYRRQPTCSKVKCFVGYRINKKEK
jgi:hypothetical protein